MNVTLMFGNSKLSKKLTKNPSCVLDIVMNVLPIGVKGWCVFAEQIVYVAA